MITRLIALGAVLAMAGCATPLMTEDECLAGEWGAAGFDDGSLGRLPGVLSERASICAEYGVSPDRDVYFAARDEALLRLCNEPGGYSFGLAGRIYKGVCTAQSEPSFLTGYLPGRRLDDAQDVYRAARSEYDNALSNLESVRWSIRDARRTLNDAEASEKRIRYARNVLNNADRNRRNARDRIDRAYYELDLAEEYLEEIEATNRSWARSPEFFDLFDMRREVHGFARSVDAIDHCTEYGSDYGQPVCKIPAGAVVTSSNGILCAAGGADARLARRSPLFEGETLTGFVHAYDIYPLNDRGNPSRRPIGFFEAVFDSDGVFETLSCPAVPEALGP